MRYIPIDAYYSFKDDKLYYICKKIDNNGNIKKITNSKKNPKFKFRTAPFNKKISYLIDIKHTNEKEIPYKDYFLIKNIISKVYEKKRIKKNNKRLFKKYSRLINIKDEIYNDFRLETQFLSNDNFEYPDNYTDYINIGLWDIEVLHNDEGFPESDKALYPINAIALYEKNSKDLYFYLLKDKVHNKDDDFYKNGIYDTIKNNINNLNNIHVKIYNDEVSLIKDFLVYISKNIDVLIGWYSLSFDTEYIYNRCKNLGLEEYFKLSFGELFEIFNVVDSKQGMKSTTWYTTKILSIDYIMLIKFFDTNNYSSYSLNKTSERVLKNKKDIKLTSKLEVGNLNNAYYDNIFNFSLYNVNDVMLIEYIDNVLLFIRLLFDLKQMTRGFTFSLLSVNNVLDSYIALKLRENNLACISNIKTSTYYKNKIWKIYRYINYLTDNRLDLIEKIREKNSTFSIFLSDDELAAMNNSSLLDEDIISNNNQIKLNKVQISFLFNPTKYPGAYVMKPKPDIYLDVTDFDAEALYPSIMYTTNCSPDTWIYLIPENIALKLIYEYDDLMNYLNNNDINIPIYDVRNDNIKTFNSNEFISLVKKMYQNELVITEMGAIFIPAHIKEGLFRIIIKEPIFNRKQTKKIMNELKLKKKLTDDNPEILSLNTKQKVLKIIANSLYGFLGYKRSRLFNLILASTITIFGQFMIREMGVNTDNIINKLKNKYRGDSLDV